MLKKTNSVINLSTCRCLIQKRLLIWDISFVSHALQNQVLMTFRETYFHYITLLLLNFEFYFQFSINDNNEKIMMDFKYFKSIACSFLYILCISIAKEEENTFFHLLGRSFLWYSISSTYIKNLPKDIKTTWLHCMGKPYILFCSSFFLFLLLVVSVMFSLFFHLVIKQQKTAQVMLHLRRFAISWRPSYRLCLFPIFEL